MRERSDGRRRRGESLLLGIGFDGDGHRRVTRGDDFLLVGGSEETHEVMQERALKFNEELRRRGKRLRDVQSGDELLDIADAAGF